MNARRFVPFLSLVLVSAVILAGCGARQDTPFSPSDAGLGDRVAASSLSEVQQEISALRSVAVAPDRGVRHFVNQTALSAQGQGPVTVPAGSVDALAAELPDDKNEG